MVGNYKARGTTSFWERKMQPDESGLSDELVVELDTEEKEVE